jgi:hypothetical protein
MSKKVKKPAVAVVESERPTVALNLRITPSLSRRLDCEVKRVLAERPGAVISRSDAVREALARVLPAEA